MKRSAIALVLLLSASVVTAAEKSEVFEKSFPSQPGKVVLVDAGPLDLSVRASDIPEIRVRVELVVAALSENQATAWVEAHRPTLADSEGELHITAPDPGGMSILKGVLPTRARIELILPPNVRPDLSTSSGSLRVSGEFAEAKPLRLRAASGDTELSGWAPEVEARSTSGDITLHASKAIDKLMVRSASGSVELTGGVRSTRCDTSSGDVHLSGLLGPAGIATTSGNIAVRFDTLAAGDEVRIETGSGRVRVALPPGCTPGGVLATTSGDIRSAYPGETDPKATKLTLSGSGPKVFVTTRSGRIDLS
jgi:hypothetical protein